MLLAKKDMSPVATIWVALRPFLLNGDYRTVAIENYESAKSIPSMKRIFSLEGMGHPLWTMEGWAMPNLLGQKCGTKSGLQSPCATVKVNKSPAPGSAPVYALMWQRPTGGPYDFFPTAQLMSEIPPTTLPVGKRKNGKSFRVVPITTIIKEVLFNMTIFEAIGRVYPGIKI